MIAKSKKCKFKIPISGVEAVETTEYWDEDNLSDIKITKIDLYGHSAYTPLKVLFPPT